MSAERLPLGNMDIPRRGSARCTHCKECKCVLSRYNPGPLCLHCEETRWDVSIDPFESPSHRVKLYSLKRIKEEQGLSWAGLAILAGQNINSIKNWSIARSDRSKDLGSCPYEEAEKIADVLGVTVAELKGDR